MDPVTIIIPTYNHDETIKYYCDILNFSWKDHLLFFPYDEPGIALKITHVDEESKFDCPPRENFPLFKYVLDENFPDYFKEIHSRGARIDLLYSDKKSHFAIIRDNSNNIFEIEFHNSYENTKSMNFSDFPFHINGDLQR